LALIIKLLSFNMWTKEQLVMMYTQTKSQWVHSHLHLLEVINWLPWVIALLVCMLWMPLTKYRWSGTERPTDSAPGAEPQPAGEPA
jgi:hypothetical protein